VTHSTIRYGFAILVSTFGSHHAPPSIRPRCAKPGQNGGGLPLAACGCVFFWNFVLEKRCAGAASEAQFTIYGGCTSTGGTWEEIRLENGFSLYSICPRLMFRGKVFHFLMLAFMALWLGVIVPVHTRGQIKLAGATPSEKHACCSMPAKETPTRDPSPCGEDREGCAVCYFIATLDLPPVFVLNFVPTGLVSLVDLMPASIASSIGQPLPFHGRAPPVA
jgi:hypothetical protein